MATRKSVDIGDLLQAAVTLDGEVTDELVAAIRQLTGDVDLATDAVHGPTVGLELRNFQSAWHSELTEVLAAVRQLAVSLRASAGQYHAAVQKEVDTLNAAVNTPSGAGSLRGAA